MSENKVTLNNTFDDEAPELDETWFKSATLYDGQKVLRVGRPVSQSKAKPATLRFPPELLDWLKSQGKGWQTRAITILKQKMELELQK